MKDQIRETLDSSSQDAYRVALEEFEKEFFKQVMERCNGNQSKAAKLSGITRTTLRKKLDGYGLIEVKKYVYDDFLQKNERV